MIEGSYFVSFHVLLVDSVANQLPLLECSTLAQFDKGDSSYNPCTFAVHSSYIFCD